MIKLIMNGACGQMGRTIIRLALERPDEFEVLCGVDMAGPAEAEGIPVFSSLQDAPTNADVLIDFSRPESVPTALAYCQQNGIRFVLGTTGLSDNERMMLERASNKIAIFHTGNMSLGVNLQMELCKSAAAALGDKFDVEITERHHNRKVDAPSGTALMLADAISSQYSNGRTYVYGRHSKNERRAPTEIGLHSLRGGTVVGEHDVSFFGKDEILTITHQAHSKQVFGMGALRAAQYIMQKQPGLYNMHDIVTERNVLSHVYTDDNQSVITISSLPNEPGVMQLIFSTIAACNVFVDMISMTTPTGTSAEVSFSLPKSQLATSLNALNVLRERYAGTQIHALDNITKITVEGPGMALRHGVAAILFSTLGAAQVCIELVTTSETKISFCVRNCDVAAALDAIVKEFKL